MMEITRYRYHNDYAYPGHYEHQDGELVRWVDIEPYIKFAEIVHANKWSIPDWMRRDVEKITPVTFRGID